ncbi:MAG: hypothetical protein JNK11_16110 [Alphaproteobacteria bacterium]|nr:hypothetical protein [Alphaproteobacteria bacterium]
MRLLKTIRMDRTDEAVFERAAAPGEIAVSGAFLFADMPPAAVRGKVRQAFANGFLGVESFGWSTFAVVATLDDGELDALVAWLAGEFLAKLGAPGPEAARAAAIGELQHAAALAKDHPVNTLLAVERSWGEDGILERFRVIAPARPQTHAAGIWDFSSERADAAGDSLPPLAKLADGEKR